MSTTSWPWPRSNRLLGPIGLGLALLVAGCGDGGAGTPDMAQAIETTYRAFDESNYQSQKTRVGLYEQIAAITKKTDFGAAHFGAFDVDLQAMPVENRCVPKMAPAAGTIADLYLQADLCKKLVGRVQKHTWATGAGTNAVGQAMHRDMVEAIQRGAAATNTAAAAAAGEAVKKTLLRFFFEAIYDEMVRRTPKTWDEGFGYWGASNDGATALGFAATARSRDGNFKTSFERDVFGLLVRGRKALADGLTKAGKSLGDPNATLAAGDSTELDRIIEDVDQRMLLVLAYSAAREWDLWGKEPDKRGIYYAEGRAFTLAIEDYIKSKDAAAHGTVRAALDKPEAQLTPADAQALAKAIEGVFGIDATP